MALTMGGSTPDDCRVNPVAAAGSECRLPSIVRGHPAVMLLIDPLTARVVDANDAACAFYGYSYAELTCLKITDVNALPPEQVRKWMELALAGGLNDFDFPHRLADGRISQVEVQSSPIETPHGVLLFSVIRDVTEQREAQKALADERARLKAVLDSELDARVYLSPVRDAAGVIVDYVYCEANAVACGYLGVPAERLVGSRMLERFPGLAGSPVVASYADVVRTGEPLRLDEVTHDSEVYGRERRYDMRVMRVGDGLSLTWRDVTERFMAAQRVAESEARFRLLAEHSGDVVAIADFATEQLMYVSPAASRTLGWEPDSLLGVRLNDLLHPDDAQVRTTIRASLEAATAPHRARGRLRRQDGSYRWIESVNQVIRDSAGTVTTVVCNLRDVEAEVTAEQELARSERQFRLALATAPIGMAVVSLDRTFVQVNPALCRMLGRTERWLLAHAVPDVLGPGQDAVDEELLAGLVRGTRSSASRQAKLITAGGQELTALQEVALQRDSAGAPLWFVSQFLDITAQQQAQALLAHLATHDILTQLSNRMELLARLEDMLAHPARTGTRLAILYCDLDGLKPVNDRLGHAAGDDLIVQSAERIRRCVRRDDIVARIGGDEFVIALPGQNSAQDAAQVADKLLDAFRQPFTVHGTQITCTTSIGIAIADTATPTRPDDLLHRADHALYDAKRHGKNQSVTFSSA